MKATFVQIPFFYSCLQKIKGFVDYLVSIA